jgi:hypothetical protein
VGTGCGGESFAAADRNLSKSRGRGAAAVRSRWGRLWWPGGESVDGERMTSHHDVANPGLREIGG